MPGTRRLEGAQRPETGAYYAPLMPFPLSLDSYLSGEPLGEPRGVTPVFPRVRVRLRTQFLVLVQLRSRTRRGFGCCLARVFASSSVLVKSCVVRPDEARRRGWFWGFDCFEVLCVRFFGRSSSSGHGPWEPLRASMGAVAAPGGLIGPSGSQTGACDRVRAVCGLGLPPGAVGLVARDDPPFAGTSFDRACAGERVVVMNRFVPMTRSIDEPQDSAIVGVGMTLWTNLWMLTRST